MGSTQGSGLGATYGANVATSQVVNDGLVLRLSAGYFNSNAYARPIGRIPLVTDPRDPTGKTTVGGALYPADGVGPVRRLSKTQAPVNPNSTRA